MLVLREELKNYSKAQVTTAKKLEKAILRIRDKGEPIADVFKELAISYKTKTYYSLKTKYKKNGLLGLLPQTHKRGCKASDLQDNVMEFIKQEKQNNPNIKGNEIQTKIAKKFKIEYTVSNINIMIKKLSISVTQGRPVKKQEVELNCAGSFILTAAVLETGYINHLISAQKDVMSYLQKPTDFNTENSSETEDQGIKEEKGVFSKDSKGKFQTYEKDSKEDLKNNGFVSSKFKSIKERVKTRDLSRLCIIEASELTLYRKNMALLFLPVLTSHGRPIEINETTGNELECFAGYDYKGNTLDKYLREMKFLQSSQFIINQMAKFWYNLWEKGGEQITLVWYFFDGHVKPLWSKYRVKKGKVTKIGRVMGCLEEVYVHTNQGTPLMLQTYSGGVYLPDAIKNLHDQIDKVIPHPVSRISIFDGGANSVDYYETFTDNNYFICILDDNQYKQDLSDMEILETNKKNDGAIFINARKTLTNSKNKSLYKVRTAVYKKANGTRYIAFVTNVPENDFTAEKVVETYYKRWPKEEGVLRDMNMGANLSTNFGFGKTQVTNLVVLNKKKALCLQIGAKEEKLKKKSEEIATVVNKLKQYKRVQIKENQDDQTKIKQLENEIKKLPKKKIKALLRELNQHYKKMEKNQAKNLKQEFKAKVLLEKLETQIKSLEILHKKQKIEFDRIKDKELDYENDIELDQLHAGYKIAFANLSAYVIKEYFPGLTLSLEKLTNKIFKRSGKLITEGDERKIIIYLNRKDKNMSNFIIKACEIINERSISLYNGTQLKLIPEYNIQAEVSNLDQLKNIVQST